MIWLLLPAALAADWFYPGPGPEIAAFDEDGRVEGIRAERTGSLLARVANPGVIESIPGVARVIRLRGDGHVVRVEPAPGVDEIALSRQLHDRPDVAWAHPNLRLHPTINTLPDDAFVADEWHLENSGQSGHTPGVDIDAELAWTITPGEGGLVAVLDTGVDLLHPDLSVIGGHDYVGGDEDSSPEPSDDGRAHGTSVAGLAAAIGGNGIGVAGVAYGADVYAIRLVGEGLEVEDFYNAFVEATDAGAWVLSNSWGFSDSCEWYSLWSVFREGLEYAEEYGRGGLGTAIVVSAGNGSCDNSNDGFLHNQLVIGVSATDGDDELEWYSSYGDGVDVAAPAGGLLTTDLTGEDGYGTYEGDADYTDGFNGTSAAAPVVSGVLTLMFAANPRLTAAEAREVLCETAEPIDIEAGDYDEEGWSPYYGCGRVNAGAAVLAVANTAPEAPVLVGPGAEAVADRVLLRFDGADLDGEPLRYGLSWQVGEETPIEVELDQPLYDLSGELEVGDEVTWWVHAIDAWGPGPDSAPATFMVTSSPEEPAPTGTGELSGGCSTGPGGRLAGPWLLGLVALAIRRRRA